MVFIRYGKKHFKNTGCQKVAAWIKRPVKSIYAGVN
jgi:hypothetical protein